MRRSRGRGPLGAAALPLVLLVLLLVRSPAVAQPGVTDTEIVLGASTALSGALAFSGEQSTRYGVDLYFRIVNEEGGVHGRRVRTIYYDDGSRPRDALANTRRLVEEDGVLAVIVPMGSGPVGAILDYLAERRVPLLFPLQGSPAVRGRRWVFGGMMLYDRQSRMTVDYLVGARKLRRLAVLYQDDEYGRTFRAALAADLARHGLRLAAAEPVRRGLGDMSAPVARARAAKPEALLLVLIPASAAEVLKQRQKIGWADVLVVSMGPLTDERYLAPAGGAAEGVEGLSLWPDALVSSVPGVKRYREAMRRHFPGNEPNRYSLAGYVAAMLFTEAARRAGRDLTPASLLTALESLRDWESGILPPITIGPDHETQKHGFWARLERGRLRPLSDWLTSE